MAHMAKSLEIPQDIIDSVIMEVGDDMHLLKKFSLVSYSFLLPSRKKLFSKITLRNSQTCQGIHQLLVQNPVIQSFVRTIIILTEDIDSSGSENPEWMNGTSLLAILRLPFSFIECLSINLRLDYWDPNPWNWNNFRSDLKDALSNIIHSPNLKTLSLKGLSKLPITFFLHIDHLTTLKLLSLSSKDFGNEDSSMLAWEALKGVAPTASSSHIVIDRCVWHLREDWDYRYGSVRGTRFPSSAYFSLSQDIEGPTKSIFLPFMCHLRILEININLRSGKSHDFNILSFLMGSLRISLTSPATLERLEFNICFGSGSNEFYFDYTFYDALRDADVWTQLDSITTHPTGLRLQRVDISINYYFNNDEWEEIDQDKLSKVVLDGLPLLRRKGILFVKTILW